MVEIYIYLKDLSANTTYRYNITSKSDLTNIIGLLRTFVTVATGDTASLTYRISLYEGNVSLEDFTYSPYFTPIELNKIGNYQDRIFRNINYFDNKNTERVLEILEKEGEE